MNSGFGLCSLATVFSNFLFTIMQFSVRPGVSVAEPVPAGHRDHQKPGQGSRAASPSSGQRLRLLSFIDFYMFSERWSERFSVFFSASFRCSCEDCNACKAFCSGRIFFPFSPSFELPMKYNEYLGSGYGYGLDPDSIRSVDPYSESKRGSRRAKMTHKNIKKLSFEVLDVFFGGLKASSVAWTSFMEA
jgi:hypothetical protein